MALADNMKQELAGIKPSEILAFNEEISQIPDVIKLTLGEPDFNTPEHVKSAAIKSIEENHSHYAPSSGIPALRKAAADFLANKYNAHYDPSSEIIVTVGATGGIYSALTAILNPGDEVIIPVPIFPLYIPITSLNGATPVLMDTTADNFLLTPEKLDAELTKRDGKVKAVVMNFPTNPTGATYTREELTAVADVLRQHDVFVISDEIYSELVFDQEHVSLGELLPEQTILLNGVSKSHAMTGYRVGILAAPKAIAQKIAMVHQFTVTSATTSSQEAALEAFQNGPDDGLVMKAEYEKRRDFVVAGLREAGFELETPRGTFYAFAKIPAALGTDSFAVCRQLAKEAKVAVIPGASFPAGEGHIRLSFAASMTDLEEAISRIKAFMATQPQTVEMMEAN